MPTLTTRSVVWLVLAAALAGVPATGQTGDPTRQTVTVPLPNGSGIFYYRAGGDSSGVRIRSRVVSGRALEAEQTPPPQAADASNLEDVIDGLRGDLDEIGRRRDRAPEGGVSRLDLLALERDLLDAIDRRLARLPAPAAPVVAPPQVIVQQAPPSRPDPSRSEAPAAPGTPSVLEVERAVLETGLFATTEVNFEFAKADLLPTAAATLDVLADVLRRYPALRVEVGGHTDSVGSDALNERLSQRRAESVLEYLVRAGVGRERLSAVGYGEARPTASNETETGRALNRRVEFTVLNPEAGRRATDRDALREIIRDELRRLESDG